MSHRYATHVQQALAFRASLLQLSEWNHYSSTNQIQVYSRTLDISPMPAVRFEADLPTTTKPEHLLATVQSFDCRKDWDDRFQGGNIIEHLDSDTRLVHIRIKGIFPVSNRDICAIFHQYVDDGGINLISFSVDDPLVPPTTGYVRAHLHLATWTIHHPLKTSDYTHVSFMNAIDVNGYIPAFLVKFGLSQAPLALRRIQDTMRKHGVVPYFMKQHGDIVLKDQQYDLTRRVWKAEFDRPGYGVVLVFWNSGFDVQCDQADEDVRVVVMPGEEDVHRVVIKIDGRCCKVIIGARRDGVVRLNNKPL
jgi:hypothetical protein